MWRITDWIFYIWLTVDFFAWFFGYRNDPDDERRSCFWFIVCLAVLCLFVGGVLWWVFG
jgi:hypothetical protein